MKPAKDWRQNAPCIALTFQFAAVVLSQGALQCFDDEGPCFAWFSFQVNYS